MADLSIDVDFASILQADKAARGLEARFAEIVKAANRGVVSQDKLLKVFNQLEQSGLSLNQVYRSMEKDLENNAKTAARLENEYRKLSLSGKSAAQSARDMERGFREQEKAAEEAAREVRKQAAEYDRLRTKFDPLYASSQLYARSLDEIDLAHKKGAISTQRHAQLVDQLNAEYQQFTNGSATAVNRFAQAQNRSTRGINNMGVQMQQAGYQIGDFIVQVQSGTNWMVAFGQQATQVAGTMTLLGGKFVAIGAALSVIIPLATAFGAAWMRTRDQTEDAIDDITTAMDDILEKGREIRRENLAEALGLRPQDLINAEVISAQLDIVEKAIKDRKATLKDTVVTGFLGGLPFTGGLSDLLTGSDAELQALIEAQQKLLELRQSQKDIEEDLAKTQDENFQNEKQALTQKIALYDAIATMGEGSRYVEDLRSQQRLQGIYAEINAMVDQKEITAEQAEVLRQLAANAEDAEGWASDLADTLESLSGMEISVTEKIFLLRQELGLAADQARNLVHSMPGGYISSGRGADPRQFMNASGTGDKSNTFSGSLYGNTSDRTSGGGSGKSLGEIIEQRSRQIQQEMEIIRLTGEAARIRQIQIDIENAYGKGLDDTQRKFLQAASEEIAANEQRLQTLRDMKEEQENLAKTIEDSMSDAIMSMIDGTKSASDAFKDMARSIISELVRILVVEQAVQSLTGAFRGNGFEPTSVLGGLFGRRALGGPVMSNKSYLVGEKGPEIFTPSRSGNIISNQQIKSGGSQEVSVRVFVDNNGNFQAMVDERANRAVAKAAPSIVNQSVGAVVERTKRGGSMKSTFK